MRRRDPVARIIGIDAWPGGVVRYTLLCPYCRRSTWLYCWPHNTSIPLSHCGTPGGYRVHDPSQKQITNRRIHDPDQRTPTGDEIEARNQRAALLDELRRPRERTLAAAERD